MKKRGATHIEFVLAFILFMTFVAFAVYIFNPAKTSRVADSSLPYAITEIVQNVSVDLTSYSVKINKNDIPDQEPTIAISIPNIPMKENVRAESYGGQLLPSLRSGDTVYVDFASNDFIVLEFSEDFDPSGPVTSSPAVNYSYYEIASSANDRILSEKGLLALNGTYYQNYNDVKTDLNIPTGINFGVSVAFSNGNSINLQKQVPAGIEVFSDSSRREILRKDGSSDFVDFAVRVW